MNQFIRPLPFAPIGEPGVAECAPCSPQSTSADDSAKFGELLDSEIEQESAESKDQPPTDAWTLYAFAPIPIQLLQEVPLVITPVGAATGQGSEGLLPESTGPSQPQAAVNSSPDPSGQADNQGKTLVELLRPAQQNVPSALFAPALAPPQTEQIAAKQAETAKKSSGIPAAQDPSMLRTSEKQEKSAEKQSFSLSAGNFDSASSASLEPAVQVRVSHHARETAPKRDLDFAELSVVDSITPEWSSFDGISDSAEVQSPQRVESTEVVEAIRTHVELLKTSSQQKLDVVLRPDGQTELRLHVEKVNGEILVQARCERGDFLRLESNWSAVQQSLANQGVRVEALQQGAAFHQNNQNFSGSFAPPDQRSNSQRENETKFIEQEFSVANRPKKSVAHSSSARGWQTWA